jgi:hypothetical protein
MSDIRIGTKVRHPSRGDGVVSTIAYSPLTGRPTKAWVEFGFSLGATRKYECWAGDLIVIEAPVERTAFKLVELDPVVA